MKLNSTDIYNLLFVVNDSYGLVDLFANQELVRLSEILYENFNKFPLDNKISYEQFEKDVIKSIILDLDDMQEYFGIKDLSKKLEIKEIVKKVYEIERL